MHVKYDADTGKWIEDSAAVNEVVNDTIPGWADSWNEY